MASVAAGLKIVVELLKVAGAVPTRCTGGIYGTYTEGFRNDAPAALVIAAGGEGWDDMPIQRLSVRLVCYGGPNDDGTAASATYQIVAGRLRDVNNEATASGRVLNCVETAVEQVGVDEPTGFVASVSEWSVLVATG